METAVTGMIPQMRERLGEGVTVVNRPEIAGGIAVDRRRAGWDVRNGLGTVVPIIGHHIEVSKQQGNSRLIAGLLR